MRSSIHASSRPNARYLWRTSPILAGPHRELHDFVEGCFKPLTFPAPLHLDPVIAGICGSGERGDDIRHTVIPGAALILDAPYFRQVRNVVTCVGIPLLAYLVLWHHVSPLLRYPYP